MNTEQAVIAEVTEFADWYHHEISSSTTLNSDLDLDELDRFELGIHIEERFGISISDETFENWQTVNDIINSVEEILKNS